MILTSYLIGPPWSTRIKQCNVVKYKKYKFIEDQVIKTKDKGIKLKNHVPRQMRVRVRFFNKVYQVLIFLAQL